jgi:S1-C subfamily serine protease
MKADANIAPGHSGAGVYDTGGALVGIACAKLGRNDALGLVRPIARVPRRWVDLLPPGGTGRRGDDRPEVAGPRPRAMLDVGRSFVYT